MSVCESSTSVEPTRFSWSRSAPNSPSDRELLDRVRGGDQSAFATLWTRHYRKAALYAASVTARFDPDDLASESFMRIYSALRRGKGPVGDLRPYLHVTLRRVAATWSLRPADVPLESINDRGKAPVFQLQEDHQVNREMLERALRSLPSRWQYVLRVTATGGRQTAHLAESLGIAPAAVAALKFRAKQGLAAAWVQAHVPVVDAVGEHKWARDRIGAAHRHLLSRAHQKRHIDHLSTCPDCRAVNDEAIGLAASM